MPIPPHEVFAPPHTPAEPRRIYKERWKVAPNTLLYTFTLPDGTVAELYVPDGIEGRADAVAPLVLATLAPEYPPAARPSPLPKLRLAK